MMKNLRWLWCAVALSVVGCGGGSGVLEEETTTQGPAAEAEGQVSQAATTCTETWGQCRVGQCELGPNDTYQHYTQTCCTDTGVCTTQRWRICGC
jgi:hypothetical protein